MVNVFLQYLYDNGGMELVNKVLLDNANRKVKREFSFCLDEVYIKMTTERILNYVPDYTADKYSQWFRSRAREDWKDEWINKELFS
jgi:hypothetical protein